MKRNFNKKTLPNNQEFILKRSYHGLITNNKLHKETGILKGLRKYAQEETMKKLFYLFLKPHIKYGSLALSGAAKSKIELINRSIKQSIRTQAVGK